MISWQSEVGHRLIDDKKKSDPSGITTQTAWVLLN
jgi:hypothetical protein